MSNLESFEKIEGPKSPFDKPEHFILTVQNEENETSEQLLNLPAPPESKPSRWENLKRNLGRYSLFILLIIGIGVLIGYFLIAPASKKENSECSCGWYQDPLTNDVWTNSIESRFDTMKRISQSQDMVAVRQTITSDGIYSKEFVPEQISFGNGGVELNVLPVVNNAFIPSAQLQTVRTDILYGSFRAMIKVPEGGGTVSSLHYYFNDTSEIDIELLGSSFGKPTQYYGIQTGIKGSLSGLDPVFWKNSSYPDNATTDFLEYRFDWKPNSIDFFLNGNKVFTVTDRIPSMAGTLILNHWAGGQASWEGEAPKVKTTMVVKSFKAYFNSTSNEKSCPASSNYCSY